MKKLLTKFTSLLPMWTRKAPAEQLAPIMAAAVEPFKKKAAWMGVKQYAPAQWAATEDELIPELQQKADGIIQPLVAELHGITEDISNETIALQLEIEHIELVNESAGKANTDIKQAAETSFEAQIDIIATEKAEVERAHQEVAVAWQGAQMLHLRSHADNVIHPAFGHVSPLIVNAFDFGFLRQSFDVLGMAPMGQALSALSVCCLLAFLCVLIARLMVRAKTQRKSPVAAMVITAIVLLLLLFTGVFRAQGMDAIQHLESLSHMAMTTSEALANGSTWTFFALSATCFLLGIAIVRWSLDSNQDFIRAYRQYRAAAAKHRKDMKSLNSKEHTLKVAYAKHQQQLADPTEKTKTNRELLRRIVAYNRMISQAQQAHTYTQRLIGLANSQFVGYVRECRALAGMPENMRQIPVLTYTLPTIAAVKFTL